VYVPSDGTCGCCLEKTIDSELGWSAYTLSLKEEVSPTFIDRNR